MQTVDQHAVRCLHGCCIADLMASCALDWFPSFLKLIRGLSEIRESPLQEYFSWNPPSGQLREASKFRVFCGEPWRAARQTATVYGDAGGLDGCELSLPSTLVRVSTGLLQADSGATLAECFFMMMSSDGLSSKPLRLHPWSRFGADTRPLDGTLDVSRAALLLSVPAHPSNSPVGVLFFSTSVVSPHPLPPLASPPQICRIQCALAGLSSRTVWQLLQFANVTHPSLQPPLLQHHIHLLSRGRRARPSSTTARGRGPSGANGALGGPSGLTWALNDRHDGTSAAQVGGQTV